MRSGVRTLAAVVVSIVVTLAILLAGELGVRIAGIEPQPWPAIDGTTFFEGIEVDPLLGPLPRPNWDGYWFDLFAAKFDAHRFRTTGYPPIERPRASIAFLGDSCTFGWGLATAETFVAQLDARQRAMAHGWFAFLNAAYPGQSAVVGEAMLRERVLPLRPQLAVIGFSSNNAFRFSLTSDADRFRYFAARKLLLHSRLFHIAAAWLVSRNTARRDPKERATLTERAAEKLERVAPPADFEAALRNMTAAARNDGTAVVFLLLPRASMVSTQFAYEDAARPPALPPRAPGAAMTKRELGVLEASCLEPRALADPLGTLHAQRPSWHEVYPADPTLRALLQQGARAFVAGDYAGALSHFTAATQRQPDAPLAVYDRGVALLAAGDDSGLRELERADALACNVFLHYLVSAWRVARELAVPGVDISLHFQAHDGDALFLDPAHPTATGHRIIADALWPVLVKSLP